MPAATRLAAAAIAATVAALSIGVAAAAAQAEEERAMPAEQEIGLLFSQTAKRGILKKVNTFKGEPVFALVLRGVTRQTVWFQDRPGRQAGHIPTPGFVRAWGGFGFAELLPNAVITVLDARHHQDTMVLTLRKPRYNAKRRTLRYRATRLHEAAGNLSHFESRRDRRIPRRFKDASLFIDDATGTVINGCLIQPYTTCPGANLGNAYLPGANLSSAGLPGVNLSDANLSGANLTYSDLRDAYLRWANLSGADLRQTDLTRANLTAADLSNALLTGADLTGADLTHAILDGARFCGTTMPNGSTNNSGC